MAKFWKVLKVIIFSVGALTLALIAYGLVTTFVTPLFKSAKHEKAEAPAEEVVFEKKTGGMKLVLKRRETEGPDVYLLTLTKEGTPVFQSYRLPTGKYHLEYVRFYDASVIPVRDNDYRIVLYSVFADDEGESESHVWFLKAAGAVTVREVLSLFDLHTTESDGLKILGNKRFGLPYQDDFRSEAFMVPVMVRVGDSISISPLLSSSGAEALHSALEQEIRARLAKPSKSTEEKLDEQYQKVRNDMNEALSEKVIAY